THGVAVRTVRPCAAAPGRTGRTSATSKVWVRDVEGLPAAPATAAFRGHHNTNRRAVRKSPRLAARKGPGPRGPDAGAAPRRGTVFPVTMVSHAVVPWRAPASLPRVAGGTPRRRARRRACAPGRRGRAPGGGCLTGGTDAPGRWGGQKNDGAGKGRDTVAMDADRARAGAHGATAGAHEVTLLTREGCGGCAAAWERVVLVCSEFGITPGTVDVDAAAADRPELRA